MKLLSLYVPLLFWSFITETNENSRSEIEVLLLGIYKCQKTLLKNIDVGYGMPNLQKHFSIYHDVDPSIVGLKATRFPYKLERENVRFDQDSDETISTLDDSGFYQVFMVLLKLCGDRMDHFGKDLRLFMSFLLCRQVNA